MRLYHFTAANCIESIDREGLTRGELPFWHGEIEGAMRPAQWLTDKYDFRRQHWRKLDLHGGLEDRIAYRCKMKIPDSHLQNLLHWQTIVEQNPFLRETAAKLNKFGDPDSWYIYRGHIPREWIYQILENPF